jgi:hypothetical protein
MVRLRVVVHTHPVHYVFYGVLVRQYRCLQSRLQCMDCSRPPCHLLMFRDVTSAHKRLSLSGFLFLRTIFTIQGTHIRFAVCWLTNKTHLHIAISPYPADGILFSICCYLHHQFFNRLLLRAGHYKIPAQQQALYVVCYADKTLHDAIIRNGKS